MAFAAGLSDLGTFPDKSKIEALCMIAEDARGSTLRVNSVCSELLAKLGAVEPPRKLPLLYTLDYISKKLGAEFQAGFVTHLATAFVAAYALVPLDARGKLRGLLSTWHTQDLFKDARPQIDVGVKAADEKSKASALQQSFNAFPQAPRAPSAFSTFPSAGGIGAFPPGDLMGAILGGTKRSRADAFPPAFAPTFADFRPNNFPHGGGFPLGFPQTGFPGAIFYPPGGQPPPFAAAFPFVGAFPGGAMAPAQAFFFQQEAAAAAVATGYFPNSNYNAMAGASASASAVVGDGLSAPTASVDLNALLGRVRNTAPPPPPDITAALLAATGTAAPVEALYISQRFRCATCGVRWALQAELTAHIRVHMLEVADRGALCTQWYAGENEWVEASCAELEFEEALGGGAGTGTGTGTFFANEAKVRDEAAAEDRRLLAKVAALAAREASHRIPVGSAGAAATCVTCGEPVRKACAEDDGEWYWMGALPLPGGGGIVHVACSGEEDDGDDVNAIVGE